MTNEEIGALRADMKEMFTRIRAVERWQWIMTGVMLGAGLVVGGTIWKLAEALNGIVP